jgi:hypothetical protein
MSAGFMAIRAKAVIAAVLCGLITLSAHAAKAADAYTSTIMDAFRITAGATRPFRMRAAGSRGAI